MFVEGKSRTVFFLQTLLFTAFLATAQKIITYDAVSGHVESLSQSVIKILTLHRVKKIFFLFTIIKRRSVAFQPCITLGGSLGGNGPKKLFSPKKWSKNAHFG